MIQEPREEKNWWHAGNPESRMAVVAQGPNGKNQSKRSGSCVSARHPTALTRIEAKGKQDVKPNPSCPSSRELMGAQSR
jgi:hypothetical protein